MIIRDRIDSEERGVSHIVNKPNRLCLLLDQNVILTVLHFLRYSVHGFS